MPLPFALYRFKKILKLTNSDILFIGYTFMRKQNGKWPYFSLAKMTREYKISQDSLSKTVKRLRALHFLTTTSKKENSKGKGRNIYDLSGLIIALEVLIDRHSEELLDKKRWSVDDQLDYAFIKDFEKEKLSEIQRANDIENGEYNK
ncbi:MAG: hypothetical protein ACD_7C00280G0004 [uncultured bacterium]|nr:MAG: hypothetical protein ACD_7C00280G0004 [uncultured bacterium]